MSATLMQGGLRKQICGVAFGAVLLFGCGAKRSPALIDTWVQPPTRAACSCIPISAGLHPLLSWPRFSKMRLLSGGVPLGCLKCCLTFIRFRLLLRRRFEAALASETLRFTILSKTFTRRNQTRCTTEC